VGDWRQLVRLREQDDRGAGFFWSAAARSRRDSASFSESTPERPKRLCVDRSGDPLSGSYMHLTAAPRFLLAPVAVSLAGGSREAARRPRRSKEYLCELQRGRPLHNRRVFLLDNMRVICEHYGTCVRESTGQICGENSRYERQKRMRIPRLWKALGKTEYLDTAEGGWGERQANPRCRVSQGLAL